MTDLTPKVRKFLHDNRTIPVVSGAAFEKGGAQYTLENGVSYRLTKKECEQIGIPNWPWDFERRRLRGKGDL